MSRPAWLRRGRFIAALFLLFALLPTAGCSEIATLREPGELRNRALALLTPFVAPSLDTADLTPVAHASAPPFGVNTFLEQEVDEDKLRRTLQIARDAGFTWIRQEFPWRDIEQSAKGDYWDHKWNKDAWEKYDRIVALAGEYGLNIIARLDAPPDWSRQDNSLFYRPPDDYRNFGDFVATVVARYRGKVRHYQIWNEPNIYPEWGNQPVKASEYTRLLQIAYQRAREADPGCVIIAAALAPTIAHEPMNRSDVLYLQEMYDAGAKDSFDVLSTMAYGLLSGADDRRADPWRDVNFSRPQLLREIMVRNGDAAKPIWISELGWNTLPAGFPEEPRYGRVTDDQQARYTVRGLERIRQEWPWVGMVNIWYLRQPGNWKDSQQEYYFRLVDPDFGQHPVLDAVGRYIATSRVLERGSRQEDYYAITYRGAWRITANKAAVLGSVSESSAPGATVAFAFRGTQLELLTRRGPDGGLMWVTVDETPASDRQPPRDGQGRFVIDLYAPKEEWQSTVTLAAGLSDGLHTVSLTNGARAPSSPGGTRVVIDALVVDRTPGFPQPLLGAGAAFAALWAAFWQTRQRLA